GDSLDGVFCRRCTCESCGNGAHIGYNCLPKFLVVSNPEPCHNQNDDELLQTLTTFHPTRYSGDENSSAHDSTPNFVNDSPNVFHPPLQTPKNSYEFCGNDAHYSYDYPSQVSYDDDDDEDYTIPITPKEPDNSLSMGDEHLDTILATESDEVIKSSVENLIPIPSKYGGIPDNTCDVPFRDSSPPLDVSEDQFEEFSDSNDDSTSIDDDYFSIDNIDYIELSPPDIELVSLEEYPSPSLILVEHSDSFLEKSDTSLSYLDISLPEFETFIIHTEETNSGSTTTHADYSLPKYDSFLFEIKPDQGDLTSVVILKEPRVHVPNVSTTHPTLMMDSDFIPSDNSLPESEIFYFDIEEKNSGSTTIHADISLSDLECFNFKREPEPGELTSIVDSGICVNVLSATNVNLPPKEDHSPLFAYVDCAKCGNPVDGHYCRHCALLRKKLKELWFKICDEQIFFQDFLNTSESSNDNSNVVNASQEPIVFNQNPREDSSQGPSQIDHQCCYGCGDSLDGVFCRRCTCESCGNSDHIGYNCLPKFPIVSNPEPCHNQNDGELPQTLTTFHPTCYFGYENSSAHDSTPNFANDSPNVFHPPPFDQFQPSQPPVIHQPPQETSVEILHDHENELAEYINIPSWNCPAFSCHDDDDEDYTIPITPKEPDNSLSMRDEHLDTILATKSNEVIKSSVENLVPIPSKYGGIPDNTCNVPFRDSSPPLDVSEDQFEEFFDSNDDSTLIDDDYFSIDNIDYIELSPPDSELVSLEEVKDDN
nr:hypothetical protein [Tanacetum cinerariifolium]